MGRGIEHKVAATGPARLGQDAAVAAILLALAALLVGPSFAAAPMTHDSFWIDYVWARQFSSELARGEIYPRWLPDSFSGLGAPVFYFYPPIAFYAVALFDLGGASTYAALLIAFGSFFFLSGWGGYLLFRGEGKRPLLGAAFLVIAPYHLMDFYLRGALAESAAIAILPFLAKGLRTMRESGRWHSTAVAYAMLIMTHLPMALLASLFMIAPAFALYREARRPLLLATIAGVGLAAIYLVPALALGSFRDEAQLYIEARLNPGYWGLIAAHWNDQFVVIVHLLVASIALPVALLWWKERDRRLLYCLVICGFALVLVPFFWSLPLIEKVQFPFRALPFAELALAAYVAHSKLDLRLLLPALLPALAAAWLVAHLPTARPVTLAELDRLMPDVAEVLPPGTIDRDLEVSDYPDFREGRVPPPVREGRVLLEPVFYFPIWSCGERDPATSLLARPAGCIPKRVRNPTELWGLAISIVTLVMLLGHGLSRRRRRPESKLAAA
jgi:hypothetical protein